MFPAWAFCLVLLTLVAARGIAAQAGRLPSPAHIVCLVGFGVLVCSLAQTPTPWSQISRVQKDSRLAFAVPRGEAFVAARTEPGEPVALLTTLGHRLAVKIGVVDVTPYTGEDSMPTLEQLQETVDLLREAGGHKLFMSSTLGLWKDMPDAIESAGFRLVAREDDGDGMLAFEHD